MTAVTTTDFRTATQPATPNTHPLSGSDLPENQGKPDAHRRDVLGDQISDRGQKNSDTHLPGAPVGPDFPGDQVLRDTQRMGVSGGQTSETDAMRTSTPDGAARPSLDDPAVHTLARWLDDLEGLRKAQANRLRILTATEPDEDGITRGHGLPDDAPVVIVTQATLENLERLEHQAVLDLQRAMRKHPLNEWRKTAKGVGEKQLARLLAAIGDPYIRADTGQPRTVSQLWAYSGLHTLPSQGHASIDTHAPSALAGAATSDRGQGPHDTQTKNAPVGASVAAKRQKGVKANWSTDAKTRAYLIATSCIKQPGTEYRAVYDARRAHTAVTHPDWTPGHSHNDALRILSKRILRDIWRAARNHHEGDAA